jgi:hypothetical protein
MLLELVVEECCVDEEDEIVWMVATVDVEESDEVSSSRLERVVFSVARVRGPVLKEVMLG